MANKSNSPGCVIIAAVVLGLFILYYIVIAMAKVCVYLGYNISFYTDNMLMMPGLSPILAWSILGLFAGSIAGVIIAVKKFKLSWMLLLYPVGITAVFMTIMILVNKPGKFSSESVEPATNAVTNTEMTPASSLKYYYQTITNIPAYTDPTSYRKVFTIRKSSKVQLLDKVAADVKKNEWLHIRYNNQDVYVNSNGLKFSNSSFY